MARPWGQRAWRQTDEGAHLEGYFSEFSGAWRRSLDFSPRQGSPAQRPAGRGLGAGGAKMPVQQAALRRAGLLPKVGRHTQSMCRPTQSLEKLETHIFMWALLFLDVSN